MGLVLGGCCGRVGGAECKRSGGVYRVGDGVVVMC